MAGRLCQAAGGNPGGPLFAGTTAGVLLLLASPAGLPQVAPPGDGNPAACRAIAEDQARLRCYDQAVDAGTAPQGGGVAPPPEGPVDGESLFGKPAGESAALARQQLGLEDRASLETTVTRTSRNAAGKLIIALANGQVWAQVDTATLALEPGAPVAIRKAALGSYLLQKQSGGRSLRVRRVE